MSHSSGYHHTEETKAKLRQANLGKTLSEETKIRVSCGMRGNKNAQGKQNALGYHFTEEQRVRSSLSKIGHPVSKETRDKIRQSNTGKKLSEDTKAKIRAALSTNEVREKRRQLALGNKHCLGRKLSDTTKAKISRSHTGKLISEEEKARLRQLNINPVFTLEIRAKISLAGRGRKDTKETKARKSQARIGMKFTKEHKGNMSKEGKTRWQNPEYRDRIVKAQRLGLVIHPNKAEIVLFNLLESNYPKQWKFVGDGSLIIGGKNPDFANINGRKELIELFGNYWHKREDPQKRINIFKHYGFRTLVIWESELKYPERVLENIADFHR